MHKTFVVAACLVVAMVAPAFAGDVLWFYGHNGFDGEGHADAQALLEGEGAVVDVDGGAVLPTLDGYSLIFIVMPGFYNAGDFFSADEKTRLNNWLAIGSHRVVMVGEWEGFYNGQAVMENLLAAIGNPIVYVPGAWDSGCNHCSGPLGAPDPLTAGLDHVCYAYTATWNPSVGTPLAYPENINAPGPYIVSNGTDIPCIVGIGDGNTVNDLCSHLQTDADSQEFVRRLYTVNCAGEDLWACCLPEGCQLATEGDCVAAGGSWFPGLPCSAIPCSPISVDPSTWGRVKATFR